MAEGSDGRRLLISPEDRLARANSALLVVDMQNDFCAPGGYISKLGIDTGPIVETAPRIARLIEEARRLAIPVIWVFAQYDDHRIPAPMLARKRQGGISAVCCEQGSWGARPFGAKPAPNEPVIFKNSYDAFHETDLDALLRALEVETLVFAGVQTNVCVESAVRHAHSLGYYIVVADDCVMSHMETQHKASLETIGFLFGDVMAGADIVARWRERSGASSPAVLPSTRPEGEMTGGEE